MNEKKKSINVCYCGVVLGQLSITPNDEYVYNSDLQNEERLLRRRVLTKSEYGLWDSKNKTSKTLFPDIKMILKNFSRADILEIVGITPTDSDWDKLVKLSKYEVQSTNLYVQQDT